MKITTDTFPIINFSDLPSTRLKRPKEILCETSCYLISHWSQKLLHRAGTENPVVEADKACSALAWYTAVCPK